MIKQISKLIIILLLFPHPMFAIHAQEAIQKSGAATSPLRALGRGIKATEETIIMNSLRDNLSRFYNLRPQKEFDDAARNYFDEVEAEQFTEEKSILAIQKALKIDRIFTLSLIREGKLTQISVGLSRGEDKFLKQASCQQCELPQLQERLEKLVVDIVKDDFGQERLNQLLVATRPITPPGLTPIKEKKAGISIWWWILGGVGLLALAAGGSGGGSSSSSSGGGSSSSGGTVGFTW